MLPLPAPTQPNEQWTTDFVRDTLADVRELRILTVLDVYARECVALVAAATFSSGDVARVLTVARAERGLPQRIAVPGERVESCAVANSIASTTP